MSDEIILYPYKRSSNQPFFKVEEILELPKDEQFQEEIHRHNFFEVFIFFSGQGVHTIDFKEYAIEKNTVHVVAPYQVHSIQRNAATTGVVLQFSEGLILGKEMESFLVGFTLQLTVPFTHFSIKNENHFEKFIHLLKSESVNTNFKVSSYLLISFLFYLKPLFKNISDGEEKLDVAFLKLVNENYKKEQKVSFYTDKLKVTVKKLNHATSANLGMTAKQVINQRRLLESKRLLHYSKLSVKEIAYELGFNSPSHFSAFFRKEMNVYPTDFLVNSNRSLPK